MDEKEKTNEGFSNFYSAVGGALLGMAIVDQVAKAVIPEMKKLKAGELLQDLKLLPSGQEKDEKSKDERDKERDDERKKHDDERKTKDNKIAELERKLAEFEAKQKGQQ